MANMHGMVILADSRGLVRSVNGAVTRLLGHDPETVRGRSILDFLHPDDRDSVLDAAQRLEPQGSLTLDARVMTADGTPLICEFTINNLLDDPVVGQLRDQRTDRHVARRRTRPGRVPRRPRQPDRAAQPRRFHASGARDDADGHRPGHLDRRHRPLPVDQRAVRRAGRRRRALGGRRAHRPDPLARPGDRPVRRRRVRAGSPGRQSQRRRDAARTRPPRRRQTDRHRRPGGQLRHPHGDRVRGAARSARRTARQREQRSDVGEAVRRPRDRRDLGRRDQRTAPPARAVARCARRRPDPAVLPADLYRRRHGHRDRSARSMGASVARRAGRRWTSCRWPAWPGSPRPSTTRCSIRRWRSPRASPLPATPRSRCTSTSTRRRSPARRSARRSSSVADAPAPNPTQLVVEITETDLLSPGAASLANMQKLRFAGIHVSIDDFGTGYSSLAHLLELPIDGVKIDRRFVAGIDIDPAATNLTTAILGTQRQPQAHLRRRRRRAALPARPARRTRLPIVPGVAVLTGGRCRRADRHAAAYRAERTSR